FLQLISDLSWLQSPAVVIEKSFLFLIVIFSVLLVQFITVKNHLAVNNLYSLYLYACFLILFPTFFSDAQLIIGNLLVLLALRSIISLLTINESNLITFHASFWIYLTILVVACTTFYFTLVFLTSIWDVIFV